MLFTGLSSHTIDPKLRLAIPAKYRNQWDANRDGKAWFCVPSPEGHLKLYTERTFEGMSPGAGVDELRPVDEAARNEASYFAFAERLEMDTAGRINLPKRHLELAEIGTEVVIIGARNRLEIHDEARWNAEELTRFRALARRSPPTPLPPHSGPEPAQG